jgi:hypothetical protein
MLWAVIEPCAPPTSTGIMPRQSADYNLGLGFIIYRVIIPW